MDLSFEKGALLLLVSAVVAILSRRLRLPYSVGLVSAGIVIAFIPVLPEMRLTKELLFTVFLPPLIFEAAFAISWNDLRRQLSVVVVLATVGVVFSAGITALGMHLLAGWQWLSAVTFGVLIAATDPVSVIATFKEARAQGRLLLLIEGESLFNDGTAAVLFAVCLTLAAGQKMTPAEIGIQLLTSIAGSVACGAVLGGLALLLAHRTDDHLVEITLTTIAAYGSFLMAQHFQFSGVLATLVTGLLLGNVGQLGPISGREREAVQAFWDYAAFVSNSSVFLLIGMREARQDFASEWPSLLIAIPMVLAARAAAVYSCCAFFARSSLRVTRKHQHVLFWGGLRGALALALVLGLPDDFPFRGEMITAAFAVVAFSVFVQGLTLTPLLRRFGEIPVS